VRRPGWLRLPVGLAAAAVVVALGVSPTVPAGAAPTAPQTAIDAFGACIAGGGIADVLMLVDESTSLRESDSELARVTSATYFVNQLSSYSDNGGLDVNVQVSVFGNSYSTLLGWTPLGADTVDTVRATIAGLKDRTSGFETDYWTALDGSRADLAAVAASRVENSSCQAVVWFTDGKIAYAPRTTDGQRKNYGTEKVFAPGVQLTSDAASTAIRLAATDDLCRTGGLADQVRSSKVYLFGVGLSGSTAKPGDFDLIESVVAGTNTAGATCGSLLDPVPGEFHLASDIDSLLFAFDAIGQPGSKPVVQETGICQLVACADQGHRFVLDTSTPDVRILASADVGGLQTSIQLPNGEVVTLVNPGVGQPTTISPQGTTLSYTWESDKTVSVVIAQATAANEAWSGLWQLAFVDPSGASADKRSRSNIHISGSLQPAWINGDGLELHVGDVLDDAVFGLVTRDGAEVDPGGILGSVEYSATLQDSTGAETVLLDTTDTSEIGVAHSVDLSDAAIGDALLTLRLGITTAPATTASGEQIPGTALEPSTVALPLSVLAPVEFPTVASSIDFGSATGDVELEGELPVSGSGCVWLADSAKPTIVAAPEGLGDIRVVAAGATGPDDCVSADSGEGLPLTLTTAAGGNGSVNGSIPVMIAPDGNPDKALEVTVSFTASLQKPLNATNFLLTLLVALVLGPGIPLLFLYAAKWIVSRIPPRALAGALVDVSVEQNQVLRAGARFALGSADRTQTVSIPRRGARSLVVAGIELRVRTGANPVGAARVQVIAPGRSSASSAPTATDRSGVRALLPLAVHNTWTVLHTPGAPASQASVLVLIGGDLGPSDVATIEDDINRRLPDVLERLVAAEDVPPTVESAQTAVFGTAPHQSAPSFSFTGGFEPPAAPTASAPPTPAPDPSEGAPRGFGSGSSPWGTT